MPFLANGYLDRIAVWDESTIEVEKGVFLSIPPITHFHQKDMLEGETEDAFIERYTNKLKRSPIFSGKNFTVIPAENKPADKSDRDYWSLKGDRLEVDSEKIAAKEARKAEKDAIFSKLKITKEEFEKIKG